MALAAAGCAEGCTCETEGPGVMTYVGPCRGAYVTETEYKFVGCGAGEFAYKKPQTTCSCWLLGGAALVLTLIVVIVILIIIPRPTTTTTSTTELPFSTTTTPAPTSSCQLFGDPHVETFDLALVNWFESGEFWAVKSTSVWIQARFAPTPFSNGISATKDIAIGGPFLGTNVIRVGPMNGGQILWNGNPTILTTFPSSWSAPGVNLWYDNTGKMIDMNVEVDKHIVHMDLPLGVHVQVMRWANHINVRITMPRVAGQDGVCGNFNGVKEDDSQAAVGARLGNGGRVSPQDLLFKTQVQVVPAPALTLDRCDPGRRASATQLCQQARPQATGDLLSDCIFDVCFGGDQYAKQDALSEGQA